MIKSATRDTAAFTAHIEKLFGMVDLESMPEEIREYAASAVSKAIHKALCQVRVNTIPQLLEYIKIAH